MPVQVGLQGLFFCFFIPNKNLLTKNASFSTQKMVC